MAGRPTVFPGVYFEPRPRAPETAAVRTDVAGFIGFEPRVRDGTTPSTLVGNPPAGHAFRVDVAAFQLVVGSVRGMVPATRDCRPVGVTRRRSRSLAGESITYALVVRGASGRLHAGSGARAASRWRAPWCGRRTRPIEAQVATALTEPSRGSGSRTSRCGRGGGLADGAPRPVDGLASVEHRCPRPCGSGSTPRSRSPAATTGATTLLAFGTPPDDGTLLGPAVRAFFANGGRRCWIATVRRPGFEDAAELARVLDDMVGSRGLERARGDRARAAAAGPGGDRRRRARTSTRGAIDTTPTTCPCRPRDREAASSRAPTSSAARPATATSRTPTWQPIFTSTPLYDPGPPEAQTRCSRPSGVCSPAPSRSAGECCCCSASRSCRTWPRAGTDRRPMSTPPRGSASSTASSRRRGFAGNRRDVVRARSTGRGCSTRSRSARRCWRCRRPPTRRGSSPAATSRAGRRSRRPTRRCKQVVGARTRRSTTTIHGRLYDAATRTTTDSRSRASTCCAPSPGTASSCGAPGRSPPRPGSATSRCGARSRPSSCA